MTTKLLWWLLDSRASWLFNLVPWPCRTWPWVKQFYWQEEDLERARRSAQALIRLFNTPDPEGIERANRELWDVLKEDDKWKKTSTDTHS